MMKIEDTLQSRAMTFMNLVNFILFAHIVGIFYDFAQWIIK